MKKSYILIGLLAAAGAMTSCSEDWDNHYEPSDQVAQESVMELIQTDPELTTFAKMLEISGYNDLLASSQTFTVFAPTNEALADVDLENVDAVKRIVLNHIARFNNSTAVSEGQTVKMYNGKRFAFEGNTFGTAELERTDIIANNGILHVLVDQIPYSYNFREYINVHESTSKISEFLALYDRREMDLGASRPIGVDANGATVYDSVMYDYNPVLQHGWYGIGDIADEDSLFTMVIPDNNAWDKAYERIRPYYNVYDKDQEIADSIGDVQTKLAIVNDLVFRRVIENPAAETDLWTTRGSAVVDPVAFFSGTTREDASNGIMYLAPELNYDNVATWNKLLEVEGEDQEGRQAAQASTIYTRSIGSDNIYYDSISESRFIEVVSSGSTATQPGVTVTIPNVLSTEYDIYVSFVPGTVTDTLNIEKTRLVFTLSYMGANGRNQNKTFRDQKGTKYVTNETEMTWMKVNDEPFTFPVSNYYDMLWLIDPLHTQNDRVNTTKLLIKTDVTNAEFNRNEMVRKFRIDRVVLVPIKK